MQEVHSIAFDSSFEVMRAVVSDPYITVVGKEGALLFVATTSRLLEPLPLPARYLVSQYPVPPSKSLTLSM